MQLNNDHMVEKIKILDLGIPMMQAWPEDCFLSSLIQKQNTAYDWMMNNFVQICSYKEQTIGMRVNFLPSGKHHYEINLFDICPYISKFGIENEILLDIYGKFTDYAIYAISKGYYVSTSLEQFYRIDKIMSHPVYIFGYDLEKGIFHTADSYYNGKYGYMEVTLEDINEGFYRINKNSDRWFEHRTYTYKLKEMQLNFDIKLLYSLLNDYLNSCYSVSYKAYEYDNMFYGIDCYKAFIEYLENIKVNYAERFDLRSLVFFRDYKMMMKKRVDFLIKNDYILQSENSLQDKINEDISQYSIMISLAIKYNITKDILCLNKIIEKLNKLYKDEFVFIEKLMAALKQVNEDL